MSRRVYNQRRQRKTIWRIFINHVQKHYPSRSAAARRRERQLRNTCPAEIAAPSPAVVASPYAFSAAPPARRKCRASPARPISLQRASRKASKIIGVTAKRVLFLSRQLIAAPWEFAGNHQASCLCRASLWRPDQRRARATSIEKHQ